ncbi:MAG: SGNH/GDSL hydrolase family protein [Clostridia bacterium]|nr:SGNH/GDSL hydrolase family protein [Clostridia bacterium]
MNPNPRLEHYEWCHIWHNDTNLTPEQAKDHKRILFIGDSITNGSFGKCRDILTAEYKACPLSFSYLITSKGIDNPDFLREIGYVLSAFNYDYIHFNNGLHGMSIPVEEYESCYCEIIEHILEKIASDKLALMNVTPLTFGGDRTKWRNETVDVRNEAIKRIADKYGLKIDDLYSAVMGKSELRADDGYHYNDDGYMVLARAMADFIMENL